ncbi:uncharacterized protein [Palaemon carinicauda]|uniref:uncharacterized protein n=1 Tax=Palaemon carinicauda TaxID=392227 RepID=UPI0035B63F0B
MKNGKAVGLNGILVEAWKGLEEEGIDLLRDFCEKYDQEEIPDEWRKSFIVAIIEEKGNIQDCYNYRGNQTDVLYSVNMGKIVDQRLRVEVEISPQQFDFTPNQRTNDAVYALKKLMERYREGQKTACRLHRSRKGI